MSRGTVNLEESLYIPTADGEIVNDQNGFAAIGMKSTDISATKVATLQLKTRHGDWSNAQEGGSDITANIAANTPVKFIFRTKPKLYFRVSVAAGATGNVSYEVEN